MKKTLLLLTLILTTQFTFAQKHSCCPAPEQFASFADDESFVAKHDNPVPFIYHEEDGEMIIFTCPDGKNANAFAVKSHEPSNNYLFVFHEWWGLNDYIKQMAEQLYNDLGKNVNVIAIDLYDGKVAAEQKDAKDLTQDLQWERVKSIITGAMNYVGGNARVTTIGWCMGGSYSLQASLLLGNQAAGCVMYYGTPETDVEKLKNLNADVLMIWANQDKHINKEMVDQFKANMLTAGKKLEVKEYTADHAFANPSNPKHDEIATKDAYNTALEFLKERLK